MIPFLGPSRIGQKTDFNSNKKTASKRSLLRQMTELDTTNDLDFLAFIEDHNHLPIQAFEETMSLLNYNLPGRPLHRE